MSKNRCCPSENSKILLPAPVGPALLQLLPLVPADPISENRTFRMRTRLEAEETNQTQNQTLPFGHFCFFYCLLNRFSSADQRTINGTASVEFTVHPIQTFEPAQV